MDGNGSEITTISRDQPTDCCEVAEMCAPAPPNFIFLGRKHFPIPKNAAPPSAIKGLTDVAPSRARRKKEWKRGGRRRTEEEGRQLENFHLATE